LIAVDNAIREVIATGVAEENLRQRGALVNEFVRQVR